MTAPITPPRPRRSTPLRAGALRAGRLHRRIGLGFMALALPLFGGLAAWSAQQSLRQVQGMGLERLGGWAEQVAGSLDLGLHEQWRELRRIVQAWQALPPEQRAALGPALLERLRAAHEDFVWIGVIAADGQVLAESGHRNAGWSPAAQAWFRAAKAGPVVGGLHDSLLPAPARRVPGLSGADRLRVLDLAAPIPGDDAGPHEVLVVQLDWYWAERHTRLGLVGVPAQAGVEVLLFDRDARPIHGAAVTAWPEGWQRRLQAGPGRIQGAEGQDQLVAAAPTRGHAEDPGLGGGVLLRQPAAVALEPARQLASRAWIGAAVAAALFCGSGWVLALGLTSRLRAAARQARRLAEPGAPGGRDEVAVLTMAIERMRQVTQRLTDSRAELQSFSRNVSHDLKGPLSSIALLLRQLADGAIEPVGERSRQALQITVDECERLVRLVDELKALALVEHRDLQRAPVDMQGLAGTVVESLRASHPTTRFVCGPLPEVAGDALLLRQVWQNLLGNAAKFSSKAQVPCVWIEAEAGPDETVFRVHDNGVGFDMTQSHRLFGVFQRLHAASEFPGSGIGLTIVQRIVRRHGGRVWAESKPQEGATFCFALARPG